MQRNFEPMRKQVEPRHDREITILSNFTKSTIVVSPFFRLFPGFDVVFDTVGGATLDSSFLAVKRYTGHVVSCLGWSTHSLAPLSFRGATYSGVFTLLPLLSSEGRAHHGEILARIAPLVEAGKLNPLLNERSFAAEESPRPMHSSNAARYQRWPWLSEVASTSVNTALMAMKTIYRPVTDLKKSSTTIATHINDLLTTSPHGSYSETTQKISEF